MDKRNWPWKKKSSSNSITEKLPDAADTTDHLIFHDNSLQDQGKHKNVTYIQVSVDSYKHLTGLEEQVCTLKNEVKELQNQLKDSHEKLYAANLELVAKEDLANKHAKVAEEAVSGWEKADAEATELKCQLESITLMKLTAEEQASRLEDALKECMKQLRTVKEDEESIREMFVMKTKQWDSLRLELEANVSILDQRLLRSAAENASISRSLQVKSSMLANINEVKTEAELQNELLKQSIQSCEKENSSLKYELNVLSKELDIRNEENNMSIRSADAANKQRLEDVKKIAKLEAECQRLRGLIRKKLPGPAAMAQMKQEAESWDSDSGESRKGPHRSIVKNNKQEISIANSKADNKEIELLTNRLSTMEEDTKILKEALAARNSELQSLRDNNAKMKARLQFMKADSDNDSTSLKIDKSREKIIHPTNADPSELMDDFLEMEKMAYMEKNEIFWNPKGEEDDSMQKINNQQIMTAVSHIHQFVLALKKKGAQILGSSAFANALIKDCESFSETVDKVLTNKIDLHLFMFDLSNILIQANDLVFSVSNYGAYEGENTNSDYIDKVLLVENEAVKQFSDEINGDSEKVFSPNFPSCTFVLELEQTKALESTKMQLEEAQLLLSDLKSELASCKKLNSLADTQVKCMAESYKSLEVRLQESQANVTKFQAKSEDLDNLLQQEKRHHQDALVKCKDLEQKLNRRWSCPMCSLSPNTDEMKNKQEREIAAKLDECQETINLLGKQLKSLQPPQSINTRQNESPDKHNPPNQ
ncbi:filament-like plant protein 4 [Impatiens glandulifera]|uniref:filament-like plant protein 4 n=1 Tax=Impatiens glandulifera TaxID=253017 RepID=UPI001FB17C62|nr:filament-like plant protein 4 [Impatiens glandulifera]